MSKQSELEERLSRLERVLRISGSILSKVMDDRNFDPEERDLIGTALPVYALSLVREQTKSLLSEPVIHWMFYNDPERPEVLCWGCRIDNDIDRGTENEIGDTVETPSGKQVRRVPSAKLGGYIHYSYTFDLVTCNKCIAATQRIGRIKIVDTPRG